MMKVPWPETSRPSGSQTPLDATHGTVVQSPLGSGEDRDSKWCHIKSIQIHQEEEPSSKTLRVVKNLSVVAGMTKIDFMMSTTNR